MSDSLKIYTIIFDLDGTIYDKKHLKFHLIYAFLFRLSLLKAYLKTRKQLEGVDFGSHSNFEHEQIIKLAELSSKSTEKCSHFIKHFMTQFIFILQKHYRPNSDILEAINIYNNKNIPIVCLSDYGMVEQRLKALQIDTSLFAMIKSSEEYGALKPSNKSFLAIANQLEVKPENVLVIGDRDDTDGQGAKNSGMHFIKYPDNFKQINQFNYGT